MFDFIRIMVLARLVRDEKGASAVEYGLLIAGVAALIVTVVYGFGRATNSLFADTCSIINRGACH